MSIVVRWHFGELKICLFFHPYVPVQVSIILLQAPPGGLPESRLLPPAPHAEQHSACMWILIILLEEILLSPLSWFVVSASLMI